MGRNYFGTDGIRGEVGSHPITPEFALKLGWAAGRVLANGHQHAAVVIGKDTRISGYMFESAFEAGLSAAGIDVLLLGPMPTPAVAYITRTLHAAAGIVISASHNPFHDNGFKFFSAEGTKLDDTIELAIEAELEKPMTLVDSASLGKARRITDAAGRYIEFCKASFPNALDLKGLKIVVDCANGATYHVAPQVFEELGAEVIAIGNRPDGLNINVDCGSTHIAALQQKVKEVGADLGIALDGDGDRLIMVDRNGTPVDGDQILYIIAAQRHRDGALEGVVGTLMSNLGLEHALEKLDIAFARAKVGDRYVMEQLRQRGWQIGGESSGHLICLDCTTTGDGIISALQVLAAMVAQGRGLEELTLGMRKYPQTMINVRHDGTLVLDQATAITHAVAAVEAELQHRGRVLLRPSGTEPLVRVMVEGQEVVEVERLARQLADEVERYIRAG